MTDLSELASIHHHNLMTRPEDISDEVMWSIESGHIPSAVDYLQAQQIRSEIKADFEKVFQKVNVLITASIPMNLAIIVTCGFRDEIPVGM